MVGGVEPGRVAPLSLYDKVSTTCFSIIHTHALCVGWTAMPTDYSVGGWLSDLVDQHFADSDLYDSSASDSSHEPAVGYDAPSPGVPTVGSTSVVRKGGWSPSSPQVAWVEAVTYGGRSLALRAAQDRQRGIGSLGTRPLKRTRPAAPPYAFSGKGSPPRAVARAGDAPSVVRRSGACAPRPAQPSPCWWRSSGAGERR